MYCDICTNRKWNYECVSLFPLVFVRYSRDLVEVRLTFFIYNYFPFFFYFHYVYFHYIFCYDIFNLIYFLLSSHGVNFLILIMLATSLTPKNSSAWHNLCGCEAQTLDDRIDLSFSHYVSNLLDQT